MTSTLDRHARLILIIRRHRLLLEAELRRLRMWTEDEPSSDHDDQ